MTHVAPPTTDDLRAIRDRLGLAHDDTDLERFRALAGEMIRSYEVVDRLPAPTLPVKYARGPVDRPAGRDNPHNAWARRCRVAGAVAGPLAGKTVALKDTIALAGVPLSNGCRALEGYVPDEDATIVTRLLDSGATILGKATCESLSLSGGSHTSDPAPVRNAHRPEFSAGGSSSGCGVLVATSEVDIAIGGDQGGSIRVPAAWSGVYGHKPTWGLVPYTGAMTFEMTVDHLGPIARTPADIAVALDVIAGWDGLDPRGNAAVPVDRYAAALHRDVTGLRVGVLSEGFAIDGVSEPDVDDVVRAALDRLAHAGMQVVEASVPMHSAARHVALPIYAEGGVVHGLLHNNTAALGIRGHNLLGMIDHAGRAVQERIDDFPPVAALFGYLGGHMHAAYRGHYYAKAQNLRPTLQAAYDAAFANVDVLALPTTPIKPTRLPAADAPVEERIARALDMTGNAVPFNLTGHPAAAVPVGTSNGLPVSMMLVAPHWHDARLVAVAAACHATN